MKETLPSLMIFNIEYLTSRAIKHFSTRIFVLVPFNYFYSWTMKQKKHKRAIYMYIHGIWSVYKKVVKWKKLFKKKEKEIYYFFYSQKPTVNIASLTLKNSKRDRSRVSKFFWQMQHGFHPTPRKNAIEETIYVLKLRIIK